MYITTLIDKQINIYINTEQVISGRIIYQSKENSNGNVLFLEEFVIFPNGKVFYYKIDCRPSYMTDDKIEEAYKERLEQWTNGIFQLDPDSGNFWFNPYAIVKPTKHGIGILMKVLCLCYALVGLLTNNLQLNNSTSGIGNDERISTSTRNLCQVLFHIFLKNIF